MPLNIPKARIGNYNPRAAPPALPLGPRRPAAFSNGRLTVLGTCPVCHSKGLLLFNAPLERGYVTKCINCLTPSVIKPRDLTMHELQITGGFTPTSPRSTHTAPDGSRREVVDARRTIEARLSRREQGDQAWQRSGAAAELRERLMRASRMRDEGGTRA